MTTLAVRTERLARAPTLTRLQRALMWLVGASGGVVFIEPAPYEFTVILAMVVFAASGMSLRLAHLPLIFLLIAYNAGYLFGVLPVADLPDTVQWTAVSMFISITTLFFALALVDDTERRLDMLLKGYLAIAVIVSIFGIITYFLGCPIPKPSCSPAARARPSRTPTCSAPSWCCPRCSPCRGP